jgi:hypothetical protein
MLFRIVAWKLAFFRRIFSRAEIAAIKSWALAPEESFYKLTQYPTAGSMTAKNSSALS